MIRDDFKTIFKFHILLNISKLLPFIAPVTTNEVFEETCDQKYLEFSTLFHLNARQFLKIVGLLNTLGSRKKRKKVKSIIIRAQNSNLKLQDKVPLMKLY